MPGFIKTFTMKNIAIILTLVVLVLGGCKKEEEEDNTPANYFTLEGNMHAIARGYLADGKIYFTSEGMTVKGLEQTTGNPILGGTGDLLSVTGIAGQQGIPSGSYELKLILGEVYTNYNPALSTADYHQVLTNSTGTAEISLEGLQCSITINGTLKDGKALVVTFSGTLTEIKN